MNESLCTELVLTRSTHMSPEWHLHMSRFPCEACGNWTSAPERHHRKFRSRGGLWVPSNVILLCGECHRAATDEAPWTQGTGLNVHSYEEPADVAVEVWYAELPVFFNDQGAYRLAA